MGAPSTSCRRALDEHLTSNLRAEEKGARVLVENGFDAWRSA
jgi:hypothetical protein